jgi:hypothetical protein
MTDREFAAGSTAMQQEIDYTAKLAPPALRPQRFAFTRGRILGVAGALVGVTLWFGTVVWFGHDLAAGVKAGTREVTAGMMVPDSES